MRRSSILILALMACLLAPVSLLAGELSRKPPATFKKHLKKLLTPAEEAMTGALTVEQLRDRGEDGAIVLSERMLYVHDDGSVTFVDHEILRAATDAGAKMISRRTRPFRTGDQTVHLPLARTLQPDGSKNPVRSDAAFVQTPQYQAAERLYTDVAEVVVIFPRVEAGSAVEFVLVGEQASTRIPGEVTSFITFDFFWPADRMRHVIELPAAVAARLKQTRLGAVPEPKRETLDNGRVRYTWEKRNSDSLTMEPGRTPMGDRGPGVWLTTLGSWDVVVEWYRELLADRGELPASLAAQVDAWTADSESVDETVRILHSKVADDIRYTALEFGIAGYQPKPPSEVWDTRYGDCKDKANLLRAMLAHKGIRSYIALLDTKHAGIIETRSPDYRHFNHAILAIDTGDGGYLWSDPTIPFLPPGMLGPQDADRDVLVVLDEGHEIAHTPPQSIGSLEISFDLVVAGGGGLSGWMTIVAEGYRAASHRQYFRELAEHQTTPVLLSYLGKFFEGAEIVDHELDLGEGSSGARFRLKTYFLVEGAYRTGEVSEPLRFPHGDLLFVRFTTEDPRETDYYQLIEETRLHLRYQPPQGWAPRSVPEPFNVTHDALTADGSWTIDSGSVIADMVFRQPRTIVPPEQFESFAQANRSLAAWMERTVQVGPEATEQPIVEAPVPTTLSENDFPLMPTGEGQLRLVDTRFPSEGNTNLRRAALQKTLQWFWNDRSAAFKAAVKLADLDCDEGRTDAAGEIRRLVEQYEGDVDIELGAWARYLLALCPGVDPEDAQSMLLELARDRGLSEFRRGWSYFQAAEQVRESDPGLALEWIDEGIPVSQGMALGFLFASKVSVAVESEGPLLGTALQSIVDHEEAAAILSVVVDNADAMLDENERARAARFGAALRDATADRPELLAVVSDLISAVDRNEVYSNIAARLAEHVAADPPAWWAEVEIEDPLPEQSVFSEKVARAYEESPPAVYLRLAIELLTAYPPDPEGFPDELGTAATVANHFFSDSNLTPLLVELAMQLPEEDQDHYEGLFLHADRLRVAGELDEANLVFERMLRQDISLGHRLAALNRIGRIQEERGEYAKALESYAGLFEDRQASLLAYEGMLRAALLHLELGRPDAAIELAATFGELEPEFLNKCDSPEQVAGLGALADDPDYARAYWKSQEAWWPAWLQLASKLDLESLDGRPLVPEIGRSETFGARLGVAAQVGDRRAFFELWRILVHAARWQPDMVREVSGTAGLAGDVAPELAADLRSFTVALNRGALLRDPELRAAARLSVVAGLFDQGEHAAVLDETRAYLDEDLPDDVVIRPRIVTLWALSAAINGQDIDEARSACEAELQKESFSDEFRSMTVLALAQIYRQQSRTNEEVELLTAELERSSIAGNPRRPVLEQRLEELGRGASDGEVFDTALARWMEAHRPAWWEFARPERLEEVHDVDRVLQREDDSWSEPEQVKIVLLVALDAERPPELRASALVQGVNRLAKLQPRYSTAQSLLRSVIDEEGFGPAVRRDVLFYAMIDAFQSRHDAFRQLLAHPLAASWSPVQRNGADVLNSAFDVPTSSPRVIADYLVKLVQEPVDEMERAVLQELFMLLLMQGALDEAREVYEATETMRLADGDEAELSQLRFQLLRFTRRAGDFVPVLAAMREAAFSGENPPSTTGGAGLLDDVRDPEMLGVLDPELAAAARFLQLRSGRIPFEMLTFWPLNLHSTLDESEASADLTVRIAMAGVHAAADDRERFGLILSMFGIVANDYSRLDAVLDEIKPYMDPQDQPLSYGIARMAELNRKVRQGDDVNIAKAIAEIREPMLEIFTDLMRINFHYVRGQTRLLRQALENLPADRLISSIGIAVNLRGLELVGLEDEAAFVREAARKQLREAILGSWTQPTEREMMRVLELSELLDESGPAYPEAWLQHVLAVVEDPIFERMVLMKHAERTGDWETAAEHARKLIGTVRDNESLHWNLGRAAYRLGDKALARESLGRYVKHCHDEMHHPSAVELLAAIESDAEQP